MTKLNGEIIDYYNVFRNMKRALSDYAPGSEARAEDLPVQEKSALFKLLDDALAEAKTFCGNLGVELDAVLEREETFKRIEKLNRFADVIVAKDEQRKEFFVYENTVTALYEACKSMKQP